MWYFLLKATIFFIVVALLLGEHIVSINNPKREINKYEFTKKEDRFYTYISISILYFIFLAVYTLVKLRELNFI